jgi:hypothetical protein
MQFEEGIAFDKLNPKRLFAYVNTKQKTRRRDYYYAGPERSKLY